MVSAFSKFRMHLFKLGLSKRIIKSMCVRERKTHGNSSTICTQEFLHLRYASSLPTKSIHLVLDIRIFHWLVQNHQFFICKSTNEFLMFHINIISKHQSNHSFSSSLAALFYSLFQLFARFKTSIYSSSIVPMIWWYEGKKTEIGSSIAILINKYWQVKNIRFIINWRKQTKP